MNITLQQAVDIYARATVGWFGSSAVKKTDERIKQLGAYGDAEGVAVYERVKSEIIRLESSRPVRRYR
jgi:hypothetical protein